ncbi:hypothetical protein GALMADRAFT_227215 [Galerina marginata CBS 339.88]|uniref:Uncharacterized protein n=1 Tax=Galerina marginata (strain CBS 339.88) TaxID=685588 RepID=A0A067SXR6_GALM3|nr:hypothetical protein GALMADRAFT_227215 [Galerina marginata CBS 339.88]
MGSTSSKAARLAQKRSDIITKQIEDDCKRLRREVKILLLGSRESGLRTIVKQMKITHKGGFSDTERAQFRRVIYENVLDSAQQVLAYMERTGLKCVEYSNMSLAEKVLNFRLDYTHGAYLPLEIAKAIDKLWKDPTVAEIIDEHSSSLDLTDAAPYFLSEVLRIGSPGYLPSDTDILRAEEKSTGIMETRFCMGQLSIHMLDVGDQPSERKKWIHCFENVTLIIFCTDLSAYDYVLSEEPTENKLWESIALFESVVNSRWFRRTSIILFLNGVDEFKNKIPKVPLEDYFLDYTGGSDPNAAAQFILSKFMEVNKARLDVKPHVILPQPTESTDMKVVYAKVKETILQNALRESGVLGWPSSSRQIL